MNDVKKEKILLIEDEKDINGLLTEYFNILGYEVVSYTGIKEAYESLNKEGLEGVIIGFIDKNLPLYEANKENITVEDYVRLVKKEYGIPLITMTGSSEMIKGTDGLLKKPFLMRELEKTIKQYSKKLTEKHN